MKEQYKNYRLSDIRQKLAQMTIRPLDILVVGATGVGKSKTLNAFFQKEEAAVGEGADPETAEISHYMLNSMLRLWDTPGLGDGIEKDKAYMRMIEDTLNRCYGDYGQYGLIDLVLVVLEGGSRDFSVPVKLLRDVIFPNIHEDRVLIAVNQADLSMRGHHWNHTQGQPDTILEKYLNDQMQSVQSRLHQDIRNWRIPFPIYYSALHDYHIYELYDLLIDHIPSGRRKIQ